MNQIHREDIHIIIRHSNLNERAVQHVLEERIYNNREDWKKFIKLFMLILGLGFTISGIIFFFAYNWADLHRFAKIGIIQGLIILTTALVFLPKIHDNTRNIILTGSSLLAGALFAVFGQIYQTGANAYDFFLAWTIFITIWVFAAGFAPLWLIYILLINITLKYYHQQVATSWTDTAYYCILLFFISSVTIAALFLKHQKKADMPVWLFYAFGLLCAWYATMGMIYVIHDEFSVSGFLLFILTILIYTLGIWHGRRTKDVFYLSVIPFSLIVILSALLLKFSDSSAMFLLVGMFIITSISLLIKFLIDFKKAWNNAA